MNNPIFSKLSDFVSHGDRAGALELLHGAFEREQIAPREAIELMLALRRDTDAGVVEAIDSMRSGLRGSYRYIPKADHAFA